MVGSYAAEIVRPDGKRKARVAPLPADLKKGAPGDKRGNPELACQPSRSTVAFELLRQRQHFGRPCPPAWRRHCEAQNLRQQRRRNGRPSSGYAPGETAGGTDAAPLPRSSEQTLPLCTATNLHDQSQLLQSGVRLRCPQTSTSGHERPAAPQLTTALLQRLMFGPVHEPAAAARSSVTSLISLSRIPTCVFNFFCAGHNPDNLHGGVRRYNVSFPNHRKHVVAPCHVTDKFF